MDPRKVDYRTLLWAVLYSVLLTLGGRAGIDFCSNKNPCPCCQPKDDTGEHKHECCPPDCCK